MTHGVLEKTERKSSDGRKAAILILTSRTNITLFRENNRHPLHHTSRSHSAALRSVCFAFDHNFVHRVLQLVLGIIYGTVTIEWNAMLLLQMILGVSRLCEFKWRSNLPKRSQLPTTPSKPTASLG